MNVSGVIERPPIWMAIAAAGGVLTVMWLQVELTVDGQFWPKMKILGSGILLIIIGFVGIYTTGNNGLTEQERV